MNVLIVRLGSLGDLVHALPVAAAIRERHAEARIDWLVDSRYSTFLELVPVIDRRLVIAPGRALRRDRPGHPADRQFPGWWGLVAVAREMRQCRYDAAIDLQGLLKSAVLARASGARRVVGFGRGHLREDAARVFYTETVDPGRAVHVVDKNRSVLAALGIEPPPPSFPVSVPVSPPLEMLRMTRGQTWGPFALVNPGAAWPNKRWPAERFGAVAASLRDRHDLTTFVLWGPGEEGLAGAVAATSRGAAIVAPPTSVGDVLAMASEARLMVSGDTGPLHLAGAVGTPIVAVFGPTSPARNGPWSPADISLSRFDECVCHYERRCRRSGPCIEEITVEDVLQAVDRRLATTTQRA